MASGAAEEAAPTRRRTLTLRRAGVDPITLAWYVPGTSTADMRATAEWRLGLWPGAGFTLEDETGAAVALSPGLPSGLSLDASAALGEGGAAVSGGDAAPPRPLLSWSQRDGSVVRLGGEKRSSHSHQCASLYQARPRHDEPKNPKLTPAERLDANMESVLKLTRLTNHLANERTFLAWIRTTVSLFGLAISTIALANHEVREWRWMAVSSGLLVSLLSTAAYVHGCERYFKVKKVLEMPNPPPAFNRRSLVTFSGVAGMVWVAICFSYVVLWATWGSPDD
ncbi:hypothetical protein EMIHUDRAFT_249902 [Emiliania huxleyi CCMP1516]|uniref:DUF202 domain-containing protein n=2 Tax=Emiliania huxleyi TaxID=2903 RepID=A0A0D3I4X8_EMIH1|nr:hypothetical protein EMIHUDRAFT_249902 [Emiliania huxleyi CCMP1516]EOD06313.1 hypothetical protein EMIHUDRAFT_249902 [Emiliania huxleyi CCMP1516]|eukprot:XP_005758742.1 hypothetical protein EMIHUDRAFT_249902 [Emiliania huxleyi CCMP1516]